MSDDGKLTILPFNADRLCTKCTGTGINIAYCDERHYVGIGRSLRWEATVTTEHLHCRCLQCQHEWIEACAGAQDLKPPEPEKTCGTCAERGPGEPSTGSPGYCPIVRSRRHDSSLPVRDGECKWRAKT